MPPIRSSSSSSLRSVSRARDRLYRTRAIPARSISAHAASAGAPASVSHVPHPGSSPIRSTATAGHPPTTTHHRTRLKTTPTIPPAPSPPVPEGMAASFCRNEQSLPGRPPGGYANLNPLAPNPLP